MTDPWADVRERAGDSDYRDLNGYIDKLLTDADALLAVVRAVGVVFDPEPVSWDEGDEREAALLELLAALPEHLRGRRAGEIGDEQ